MTFDLDDLERIEDQVCEEDRQDILANGWGGGRNGNEQAHEILFRIRMQLEDERENND